MFVHVHILSDLHECFYISALLCLGVMFSHSIKARKKKVYGLEKREEEDWHFSFKRKKEKLAEERTKGVGVLKKKEKEKRKSRQLGWPFGI